MKLLFARVTNPVRPDLCDPVEVVGASTIREVLKKRYGENFIEFPRATVMILNDKYVMRAAWDKPLQNGDIIVELPIAAGVVEGLLIGLVILAVVAAIVVAASMKTPKIPGVNTGNLGEPPSVYSLSGQRNQSRLNFPIEVAYGRNRMFPSYAAPWYNRYDKNNQYMYALFCLGQGSFDIEQIFIEDTVASMFPEAQITIIPPGGGVSMMWPRVITSVEAASIEMLAPNDVNYPGGMMDLDPLPENEGDPMGPLPPESGWFGPFTMNPWGTTAWKLEADIVLPGGAYKIDAETGEVLPLKVALQFQYRALDGDGVPGEWQELWSFFYEPNENEEEFYSGNPGSAAGSPTPTPLNMARRMTLSMTVGPGRWQVRGRRLNKKNTDTNAQSMVQWEAARAYLDCDTTFGDVTLISVVARATNGVNNGAANRVNCIATRKIPQLVETTTITPVGEPLEYDEDVWVNGTPDVGQAPFDSFTGGRYPTLSVEPDGDPRFASFPLPTFVPGTQLIFDLSMGFSAEPATPITGFFFFTDADGLLLPADGEAYMTLTLSSGTLVSGEVTRMVPTGAAGVSFMLTAGVGQFVGTESLGMSAAIIYQQLTTSTTSIGFTETEAASTDPIDAFCDIVRNTKYGANLSDDFLDIQSLFALKERLAEVPYAFNYVFDQKTTVWSALSVVAQATRCIPTLSGSLITMVRDEITEIPLAVFSAQNIVKGSFNLQTKLAGLDEYDGLLVQYLDAESWAQETVLCKAKNQALVEIEEGLNPDNTILAGVTNREQAYKEGLYQRQSTRLMRSTISFSTGLEGYIPAVGDMISVTMDVPKWGQSGFVATFISPTQFKLKDELVYTGSISDYRILFRTKIGTAIGPETVSGVGVKQTDGTWLYNISGPGVDLDELSTGDNTDPVVFLWGVDTGGGWSKLAKILTLAPNDDDTVTISAYIYDKEVFNGTEPDDPGPPDRTPGGNPGTPGTPGGFPVPPSPAPSPSNDYQFKLDERLMSTDGITCEVYSPWKAFTTWKPWTYELISTTWPGIEIEIRVLEDEGYDDYIILSVTDDPSAQDPGTYGGITAYPFRVGKFQMRILYVRCEATTIPGPPDTAHALIEIQQNPA